MTDPNQVLEEDDEIVVLKDLYPKARHHYLVLPKKEILSIKSVTLDDLDLLDKMEKKAQEYADSNKDYDFQ